MLEMGDKWCKMKGSYLQNRESYMSAHVLLNLSSDLGKKMKCEACQTFYLLSNEFNKFNKTTAQMLDYIYHMT